MAYDAPGFGGNRPLWSSRPFDKWPTHGRTGRLAIRRVTVVDARPEIREGEPYLGGLDLTTLQVFVLGPGYIRAGRRWRQMLSFGARSSALRSS